MIGNTFRGEYNILRLLNQKLVSSFIEITLDLEFDDDAHKTEQVTALTRMKRWLDDILDESLAFSTKSDIPTATLEWLENNLMFCPDEPHDFMLMLLINAKLNAIGQGFVSITNIHITSNLGEGFGNWFQGNPDDVLPNLEEWVGDKAYYDKQWWNRPDGSMIDMWVGPDDDAENKPDILIDLDADVLHSISDNSEAAEIIKPNFTPTIIRNE